MRYLFALALLLSNISMAGAQNTVAVGDQVMANVAFCLDEGEANNVLLAHRNGGLEAGKAYLHASPICSTAVVNFKVVRQVAEHKNLASPSGPKTFYVVEAEETTGTHFFIITIVRVNDRTKET